MLWANPIPFAYTIQSISLFEIGSFIKFKSINIFNWLSSIVIRGAIHLYIMRYVCVCVNSRDFRLSMKYLVNFFFFSSFCRQAWKQVDCLILFNGICGYLVNDICTCVTTTINFMPNCIGIGMQYERSATRKKNKNLNGQIHFVHRLLLTFTVHSHTHTYFFIFTHIFSIRYILELHRRCCNLFGWLQRYTHISIKKSITRVFVPFFFDNLLKRWTIPTETKKSIIVWSLPNYLHQMCNRK